MNIADLKFKELLQEVFEDGMWDKGARPIWSDTGEEANSLFITQYLEKFNISKGEFPITEIKPTAWKTAIKEILWIYSGASNSLSEAREKYNIQWWDAWDVGNDTIGQRYGHTVKRFDLLNNLLEGLNKNPYGRRHIMNLWQNIEFEEDSKGLPPCAFLTMWSVRGEYLDMTLVQRSQDCLGANNVNNIQYVALLMMVAHATGYKPGKYVHFIQNLHIYDRHIEIAKEFLNRPVGETQPKLIFEPKSKNFYDFTIDDFRIEDYNPQGKIFIPIAE